MGGEHDQRSLVVELRIGRPEKRRSDGRYDYANKFENGELPPGADASVGAITVCFTKTVAAIATVVLLAAALYGPVALFTIGLAS
jgi:hypothetical protein